MSELRDIVTDSIADRESVFGDAMVNVRTTRNFMAEIQPIADMELNATLGRDPREAVTFHVRDLVAAAEIQLGDLITAIGSTFKILRRSNNPVSAQVEFGAMKMTNKDA
jgi:hypothetical protein